MTAYIRAILLLHVVLTGMLMLAITTYFRTQASAEVQDMGERINLAFARNFASDIWPLHHDELQRGITPAAQADLQKFLQTTGLAGIRIYNMQGVLEYSTGGTVGGDDFMKAKNNPRRVTSHITDSAAESINGGLTLTESFIPIGPAGTELFVEFFSDVSANWSRLTRLQLTISGSVMLVSIVLAIGMILIYRKAEIIIGSEHEKNAELAAQAISAQEETKQKSQFLASISHELRTPLNAIIGFSNIIKNEMLGESKNPQFPSHVNDIYASGVHLLSLINDILDFSKAEAGKLELEIEEVNATKQAINSLNLVLPRAESGGVRLVNNMPKEPFVVETDAKKFKQILLNLLSNAVKFTPSGGSVSIAGWQDLAEDTYVFEVKDTGIGIAQKDIAKAMAPFGQVDSALSRKYEGTGLGLPLTRKFIELMGGKFSIQSEQGQGTTITFSLPRKFKARDGVVVKRAAD